MKVESGYSTVLKTIFIALIYTENSNVFTAQNKTSHERTVVVHMYSQ